MDEELRHIPKHMLWLGQGALAHSIWHGNYYSLGNELWSELSVIQAAHAAEILIKARIAEEHPLLIFETLPKLVDEKGSRLGLDQLIESGHTYQYTELPERLWATTGIKLPNLALFHSFGKLRNAIQHFASPDRDVAQDTLEFIFGVIDPFINQCWGLYAIDHNEDEEPYVYLISGLVKRGIHFLVSANAAMDLKHTELEWPKGNKAFESEMTKRFADAQRNLDSH